MSYLVLGVDTSIGSSGNSKFEISVIFSKDDSNGFYKFCLNSSKSRLFGKAAKVRAVIAKVNPVTTKPVDRQVNGFSHF
jgi:hypothetical protein